MHLFKSQWLQEPGRRVAVSYRQPAFGQRYGRHAVSPRTYGPSAPPPHDNLVVGDFQAEREILREMARYDHAA